MTGPYILTSDEVQRLALEDWVRPHPTKCHAYEHGVAFRRVQAALTRCFRVQRGSRPKHAEGWIAHCFWTPGSVLRVDFDLDAGDRPVLLIVTAMELTS